ncbi:MAG TPA: RNA 2',3'-cyclic phosphodiesterase [Burkholderiales bacterium]|nr:RNA 2',3'-cyclic phosphodiesterase [Burkholderiales bacterium]
MRLFFALWPDEGVRAQLAHWSRELKALCGGRPTRAPNLHLTLAFLGTVEAGRVADVERAAGAVAPVAAALLLDRPGFWKSNRIAWAGASAPPAAIERLALDLRGALARAGIDFDAKPFATHVTLLRGAREPSAMPALTPVRWEVDGFVLARSRLQAGAGRYEIVNAWQVPGRVFRTRC